MNNSNLINSIKTIAQDVYKSLGMGFSESMYHQAMLVGLREKSIPYESETIIPIKYKNHNIGNIRSDIIIGSSLIVELKAVVQPPNEIEKQQLLNYLYALNKNQGIIINFPQPGTSKNWIKKDIPDFYELNINNQ